MNALRNRVVDAFPPLRELPAMVASYALVAGMFVLITTAVQP